MGRFVGRYNLGLQQRNQIPVFENPQVPKGKGSRETVSWQRTDQHGSRRNCLMAQRSGETEKTR